MTALNTKYPIHPLYQGICDLNKEFTEEVFKKLEIASDRERLETYLQIRASSDAAAAKRVVPQTLRTEQIVEDPNDIQVKTTMFRPLGSENEVLPVIIFCHGGGWVFCNTASHSILISDLCIKTHVGVMAVEYDRSPEVQFPIANEQVFAALCWLRQHGPSIHINPDKIAIVGDSAGGNMSAVLALMAKERDMADALKAQVLFYPVVSADVEKYESYKLYGNGDVPLSINMTKLCYSAYLPKPVLEYDDPFVMPMRASLQQLEGLPPAFISTCECDILRDEGEAYAARLLEAGVETVGLCVMGTIHGYLNAPVDETPQYRMTVQAASQFLRDQFTTM